MSLSPQGSVDHLKGGYVQGLWEDMFSSYKELAEKSLAIHLLKDGSRLEDCVDSPQAGLQAWIRVHVGMCGLLLGFDLFGPFEWICWAKIHGTHNHHKDKIAQQDDEQDHVVTSQ